MVRDMVRTMVRPAPSDWSSMDSVGNLIAESLDGLPFYLGNFGAALLLLTVAMGIYSWLGGAREIARARQSHLTAAASYAGALLGLALALASVVAGSASLLDLLSWSTVVLAVQLAAMLVLRQMLIGARAGEHPARGLAELLHGAVAVAIGLLNAAAVMV